MHEHASRGEKRKSKSHTPYQRSIIAYMYIILVATPAPRRPDNRIRRDCYTCARRRAPPGDNDRFDAPRVRNADEGSTTRCSSYNMAGHFGEIVARVWRRAAREERWRGIVLGVIFVWFRCKIKIFFGCMLHYVSTRSYVVTGKCVVRRETRTVWNL